MKEFFGAVARFVKSEVVLTAAIVLALISMCIVPPSAEYAEYIDLDTLALLFALMAVMKAWQRAGVFGALAHRLLKSANTSRKIAAVLVYLPFFLSMIVTNDVALITFVPFAIIVLKAAGLEKQVIPVVVLQTLAANLGSMLTPIGNPQNLYLYNRSGMEFWQLMLLMLPYAAVSALGLAAGILLIKSRPAAAIAAQGAQSGEIQRDRCVEPIIYAGERAQNDGDRGEMFGIIWPAIAFCVCLLALFKIVPAIYIAAAMAVFLLIFDRRTLAAVDYSLLLTFAALFIFIGNMGNIPAVHDMLAGIIDGNELIVAVAASQVISNVPAALLLSGFSSQWNALIAGCNLGGLGTLIASMASLISYKTLAAEYPGLRAKYLGAFTLYNVIFLAVLLGISCIPGLV